MVEAGTFCVNADVVRKAGQNANPAQVIEAFTNQFIPEAEAIINTLSRFDWTTPFLTLQAKYKLILQSAASDKAAIWAVSGDMSGYTSRAEAETLLDVLTDSFNLNLSLLKDSNKRKVIQNGA